MFKTSEFAKKGSAIIAVAVLGLMGLGRFAPTAHASPNSPNDTDGSKRCELKVEGHTLQFDAGTKITITHKNGTSDKLVCNGKTGSWDIARGFDPRPPVRNFSASSVTLLSASGSTAAGNAINQGASVTTTAP